MSQEELEAQRDSMDLLTGISQDGTRQAIIRSFERKLSEYVADLLSGNLDDASALHTRAKALGVLEALASMGVQISRIAEYAPVRRVTEKVVRQFTGL